MAFTLSPSVTVTEQDFSGIVSLVATTPAAFVGRFDKGPINTRTLVSSVKELQETFGTPSVQRYGSDWWSCFNFLQYGNNLTIVRVAGVSASSGNAGLSGGVDTEGSNNLFVFNSKDVGSQVNGALEIQIATAGLSYQAGTATDVFSYQPNTSSHAARFGASGDELSLAVIDRRGVYGPSGSVLELYEGMSQIINAVDDVGNALYYKYVLAESDFIEIDSNVGQFNSLFGGLATGIGLSADYMANDYVNGLDVTVTSADLDTNGDLITSKVNFAKRPLDANGNVGNSGEVAPLTYTIQGGSAGGVVGLADKIRGWTDYFLDSDEVDVSMCIAGDADNELNQHVIDLAVTRKDCIALVSLPVGAPFSATADALINKATLPEVTYEKLRTYRNSTLQRDSSYAVMDGNWKYMSDSYNGVSRWMPLNADIAGLLARTETDFGAWFSPAGQSRGNISNVIKLAFNPTKSMRDGLYSIGINNVFAFPGSGTVLWGDKTLQTKPSAFDRIQVRRLFNILEKSFATSANFVLFEQNDAFTRQNFISQIEPVLRDVQNRRGLENYRVVCDESNNSSASIDRGEFIADIYLQPTRSIQFVKLNFVANNSGSFFTEG
jgi:hypothetical protein